MSSFHNFGPAHLPVKTTVAELQSGDKFDYNTRPGKSFRDSAVVSVTDIGGTTLHGATPGAGNKYAEGMHRVIFEDSDGLGTLFYGHETVYRAKRAS
jgi:hypothetical protein